LREPLRRPPSRDYSNIKREATLGATPVRTSTDPPACHSVRGAQRTACWENLQRCAALPFLHAHPCQPRWLQVSLLHGSVSWARLERVVFFRLPPFERGVVEESEAESRKDLQKVNSRRWKRSKRRGSGYFLTRSGGEQSGNICKPSGRVFRLNRTLSCSLSQSTELSEQGRRTLGDTLPHFLPDQMMRLSAAVAVLLASMAPGAVQGFAATGATSAALRQSGFVGGVAAPAVESKVRTMHPAYSLCSKCGFLGVSVFSGAAAGWIAERRACFEVGDLLRRAPRWWGRP